jgi:hypothetical protein
LKRVVTKIPYLCPRETDTLLTDEKEMDLLDVLDVGPADVRIGC